MKIFQSVSVAIVGCAMVIGSDAQEVGFRWGTGFAMGTVENIIHNADEASFNMYCPSGQTDTTPGIFFHSKRYNPAPGEEQQIQIVAGDEAVLVNMVEGHFEARGRLAAQSMWEIADLLARSDATSFTVEIPRYQIAEQFSLSGAAEELLINGQLAIESCL